MRRRISPIQGDRHFCATFEGITAPFWGIFVTGSSPLNRGEVQLQ
jgi:hypothetical protein